jgi:hypothetical protein
MAPDDHQGFILGARRLFENPCLREEYATHGLDYAKEHFKIQPISEKFQTIFDHLD